MRIRAMSGAQVIISRGLPDGFEPPSTAVTLDPPALTGCQHRQAAPVILSTEETVACVCIACLESLPADWIDNQRDAADREAHCTHGQSWDDRRLGSGKTWRHCDGCGASWEV